MVCCFQWRPPGGTVNPGQLVAMLVGNPCSSLSTVEYWGWKFANFIFSVSLLAGLGCSIWHSEGGKGGELSWYETPLIKQRLTAALGIVLNGASRGTGCFC